MRRNPLAFLSAFAFAGGALFACASAPPPAPAPTPSPVSQESEPQSQPEPEPEPAPAAEALAPAPAAEPSPAEPPPAAKAKSSGKTSSAAPSIAAPTKAAAAAYAGPNPCTHAVGGKGIIDQACARGGVKEAKVVMKDMVKKAKKQGVKFDCDSCHKDETNWALFTDDAKEKFEQLLELSQK